LADPPSLPSLLDRIPSPPAPSARTGSAPVRTVVYSRAATAPPEDGSETIVGPDIPQPIVRTSAQLQSRNKIYEDDTDFTIRTDLPSPERLFDTRKSEVMMREYIRRESQVRAGANRVLFPEYQPLSNEIYVGRAFPRQQARVEPNVVCHGRLFFEQKNLERSGWDFGYLTVPLALGKFYYDIALFPYHAGTQPCNQVECNVGKCNPGDPTPFFLYREPFSLTGLATQSFVIGTGFIIAP
jgi:hypothetical protein